MLQRLRAKWTDRPPAEGDSTGTARTRTSATTHAAVRPTIAIITADIPPTVLSLICDPEREHMREVLLFAAKELGGHTTQAVGRSVKLPEAIISDIMRDYSPSQEQRFQCLRKWYYHNPESSPATIATLLHAIHSLEPGCLGDADVAEKTCSKIKGVQQLLVEELQSSNGRLSRRRGGSTRNSSPDKPSFFETDSWKRAHKKLNIAAQSDLDATNRTLDGLCEQVRVLTAEGEESKQQITKMERQMEALGAVNMKLKEDVNSLRYTVQRVKRDNQSLTSELQYMKTKLDTSERLKRLHTEKFKFLPVTKPTQAVKQVKHFPPVEVKKHREAQTASHSMKFYSYDILKRDYDHAEKPYPVDVDQQHLEEHLCDSEFFKVFNMSKIDFRRLKEWKQRDLKKRAKLF